MLAFPSERFPPWRADSAEIICMSQCPNDSRSYVHRHSSGTVSNLNGLSATNRKYVTPTIFLVFLAFFLGAVFLWTFLCKSLHFSANLCISLQISANLCISLQTAKPCKRVTIRRTSTTAEADNTLLPARKPTANPLATMPAPLVPRNSHRC